MPKAAKVIKSAGGVGESKIFCAPEAERLSGGVDRILKCHVNGTLIADLNLDPQVLSALDYYATDEGIAEKENHPDARPSSGITLTKEPFDKALDQRRDDVKVRDMDLPDSRDPFKEVADKYAKPGMTPKFLSARRIQEEGSTGIHEVVKRPDGEPVKVKGMVLAHAPTERVNKRNEAYRQRGAQLIKQIEQQHQAEGGGIDR